MRDFTLTKFGLLLSKIKEAQIPVYPVLDWFEQKPARGVFIRHDVDRTAINALMVAELEHSLNIRSTYYFRITRYSFVPKIIKRVAELGHEVGYHYEDLALSAGNLSKAISLFEQHLKQLRELVPVKTIAMHGSPLSAYDNREMWQEHDFRKFNLKAEAFLSIDYNDTHYFTDTGRTWGESRANLRDRPAKSLNAVCDGTDDLIDFILRNPDAKIAIAMHPERWSDGLLPWSGQWLRDQAFNLAKLSIRALRGPKEMSAVTGGR